MTVSVVIATYNGDKYLNSQLNSITNQSTLPDEIIIVDDCSSDKTKTVIASFIKELPDSISVKFIENSVNLGVVKTFKKGIQSARMDLVFLSDQDDVWRKDKIEIIKDVFNSNKDINLVSHAYKILDESENYLSKRIYPYSTSKKVELRSLVKINRFPGCTYAFKRLMLLPAIKGISDKVYIHDWYLALIATAQNRMYYLNFPLIKYRIHSNNTIGVNKGLGFSSKYSDRNKTFFNRASLLGEVWKFTQENIGNNIDSLRILKLQELFFFKRVEVLTEKSVSKFIVFTLRWFFKYDSVNSLIADLLVASKIKRMN